MIKKKKFLSGKKKKNTRKKSFRDCTSVYGLFMHTNNVEQGIAFMILRIWVEEYLEIFYFDCTDGNKISVSHKPTYEENEICYA